MVSEKILTISIASYNAEKYLDKCLSSLVNAKSLDKLEIFIVNDGSTDNTLNIAQKYRRKYPGSVYVIDKENGGHGSTINSSISASTAKYFKIVDADDWVETDNLDKLIEFLSNTECDVVLNPYYEVNALNESEKKLKLPHDLDEDYENTCINLNDFCKHINLAMHSMTIKTEVVKKMGPVIDEHCFYVDLEYILLPFLYMNTVSVLKYPIYDYLLGTATQSMNLKNLQKRRNQHLKVIERVIDFYEMNSSMLLGSEIGNLIKKRILSAILLQYIIYLKMEDKSVFDEYKSFDSWLNKTAPDLYEDFAKQTFNEGGAYLMIIKHLRKSRLSDYYFVTKVIRFLDKIKNKG